MTFPRCTTATPSRAVGGEIRKATQFVHCGLRRKAFPQGNKAFPDMGTIPSGLPLKMVTHCNNVPQRRGACRSQPTCR